MPHHRVPLLSIPVARLRRNHLIKIGDSISTLSVSEIEMPSPNIQRPGASIDAFTRHWPSLVRAA
jgi:hypothetical protein